MVYRPDLPMVTRRMVGDTFVTVRLSPVRSLPSSDWVREVDESVPAHQQDWACFTGAWLHTGSQAAQVSTDELHKEGPTSVASPVLAVGTGASVVLEAGRQRKVCTSVADAAGGWAVAAAILASTLVLRHAIPACAGNSVRVQAARTLTRLGPGTRVMRPGSIAACWTAESPVSG